MLRGDICGERVVSAGVVGRPSDPARARIHVRHERGMVVADRGPDVRTGRSEWAGLAIVQR